MQRTIKLIVVLVSLTIGAIPSFSQSLPDFPGFAVESGSGQNSNAHAAMAANKIDSGIVYLPITNTAPVVKLAGDQVDKMTGSINIASIINFNEPGTKFAREVSQAGTIASIGDVGIVISTRAPSNEWERYTMESSPQVGIMASGVMAAFKIPIW